MRRLKAAQALLEAELPMGQGTAFVTQTETTSLYTDRSMSLERNAR